MRPRKTIAIASLTILAMTMLIVGLAGGCVSSTLPARISPEQLALLHKTRIAVSIGVEEYKFPVYSESLTKALGRTNLFARVDRLANFSTPPDIVARVEDRIRSKSIIPVLTGLSLGLIPTTANETHGYSFSLSRPGDGALRVPIRFEHSGPTTLGWWAVILNLSPNRAMGDIRSHPRFIDSFAAEIMTKRDAIESLKVK